MGLLIRLLVIVIILSSHVASSGSQRTYSHELDTSSKIDELKTIVSNYLEKVYTELRNTKDQVEELKVAVSDIRETVSSELEETRRHMEELQVAVSSDHDTVTTELRNATNQLEDTRRQMKELKQAVSGHQETVSSELQDTRLKMNELQVSVSSSNKLITSGGLLSQCSVRDCSDILERDVTHSGVYTVNPLYFGASIMVYCDMETDGGGWTVFQRRQDGSVDFYLDFTSYIRGFGDLKGEFWLGNDNLHRLTAQGEYRYELRVDLSDYESNTAYAVYDSVSIADVSDNYRLVLGAYSGTAGDGLAYHNNRTFTTKDRDNDLSGSSNCAQQYHGAWWYRSCYHSNLNGMYFSEYRGDGTGIRWAGFSESHTLKTTEMKIRRKH